MTAAQIGADLEVLVRLVAMDKKASLLKKG